MDNNVNLGQYKTNLLLELFSEEIPAAMQKDAELGYKLIFENYFSELNLAFDRLEVNSGPRRIVLEVRGLPSSLPAREIELRGPKLGAPKAAIDGFCKSNGVDAEDLVVKNINSDSKSTSYYFLIKTSEAIPLSKLLSDTLSKPISDYTWPKSMYWGDYKIKWIRPLKNILCILEKGGNIPKKEKDTSASSQENETDLQDSMIEIVPFQYGHLKANNLTYGHRFASKGAIEINSIDDYKNKLAENFVILSRDERLKIIQDGLNQLASEHKLIIKEDPILLEEVIGLADYPKVLCGKIEDQFLQIPSPVLITSMRSHQKYFSSFFSKNSDIVADYNNPSLADDNSEYKFSPYFLFISNAITDDYSSIINGNEKVLSARLSDALYFYTQDLQSSLKEKSKKLHNIVFHEKLGSMADKVSRLCRLCLHIDSDNLAAATAASLSKGDIVSEMVGEFPNLQGLMGYYYSISEGHNKDVAESIRDQYKPAGTSDNVPLGPSCILALSDKLDSLCGLMLAGIRPTGSKDPYSLRRMALGILKIIIENKLDVNIKDLLDFCINNFTNIIEVSPKTSAEILLFIEERFKYYFRDKFDPNLINACFDLMNDPYILSNISKLEALSRFSSENSWEDLIQSYKRINNLLASYPIISTDDSNREINNRLLYCLEERSLVEVLGKLSPLQGGFLSEKKYYEALELLPKFTPALKDFFDNVLVKDDNIELQDNRVTILRKIKSYFERIAKFYLVQ